MEKKSNFYFLLKKSKMEKVTFTNEIKSEAFRTCNVLLLSLSIVSFYLFYLLYLYILYYIYIYIILYIIYIESRARAGAHTRTHEEKPKFQPKPRKKVTFTTKKVTFILN